MTQGKAKGSVIVMGGGIAGMQAALSLANTGYGVHLIEQSAYLGGMIPSLHRIYPICACCRLDPRIAACRQDPNIRIHLNTSIRDISGETGKFKAVLDSDGRQETVDAGAILLAAGIETFEPSRYDTYAYGRLPNVITSVEYEQLQKPLGPNSGLLKRPSDGKRPEKIAWLQCVGSREVNQCDAPYCSTVCCMHALKEAMTTKDQDEDIDTSIFYMDMRAHGKGFEDYLNNAVQRGVNLIRSRVHTVDTVPGSDDLAITYADESEELHIENFDMVVLSVGLRPSSTAVNLAKKCGIELKESQFIATTPFMPVSTNVPGIFVSGGIEGPADISESITQSDAAVSEIISVLAPEPFSAPASYPEIREPDDQEASIFVAYNLCPGMDPEFSEKIEECAKALPGVAAVSQVEGDLLDAISEGIKKSGANRLVFASCTPVVHEGLVREALRLAGINPYLYETVDLRAIGDDTISTQIEDRLRMGASRVSLISPPSLREIAVSKSALVVGGGIAGLESARALSLEGYPVTVIEKEKELGGHGLHVRNTWQGYDVQGYLKGLISSARNDNNITIMTETEVAQNKGFAGNFSTTVIRKGKEKSLSNGAIILAPGGESKRPEEYLYGEHDRVFTWQELSARMIEDPSPFENASSAVFIQCVGSRQPDCPHCSNFCCTFAVRAAIDLKTNNPSMKIFILYREMRTFGERENLYKQAREKGVIFIRYDMDSKPEIEAYGDKGLKVTVFDPILQRSIALEADFISLQTAIVGSNNNRLSDIFKVDLDSNGFFAESPEKLKPQSTSIPGIYTAGLAHYPKDSLGSIGQAKAAAACALEILSRDTVQVGGAVAEVNPEKCAVCCTCVRTCPFQVPVIDHSTGAAYIDPGLCQGCGMCVAECPGKAIVMSTCSDDMLVDVSSFLTASS